MNARTQNPLSFIDAESVKKWIEENLSTVQRVEDVARGLKMHPETLRKTFVRAEGVSLSDYLRKKRVEVMKHLLVTTDLKCYAICRQVGIKREDTGVKLFKRTTGMTMDEYRQSHDNVGRARERPIAIGLHTGIANR